MEICQDTQLDSELYDNWSINFVLIPISSSEFNIYVSFVELQLFHWR